MARAAILGQPEGVIHMTSFDLIRKAIRYEPVPRPPVAVLDGYNWFLKRNGMTEQDLYAMSEEEAAAFVPPAWFDTEVTFDSRYHNSNMSKAEIIEA